jgi:D-galacturonate reductase
MVGTGEYTTGFVQGSASSSDKSAGVLALTCFDLRDAGKVGQLLMAGTNGAKFPAIRAHLNSVIGERYQLDTSCKSFPADGVDRDPTAYLKALDQLSRGDVVIVFTPDDVHFEIACESVERGCHVLVAKPIVKTVEEHRQLTALAEEHGVLVAMEVHKRWDPIYADARDRIRGLGEFSFFNSYMSQPKSQLESFRAWAGKSSDISYYLNAHHIDFNVWATQGRARPISVVATASTGVAKSKGIETEDTITLTTQWENIGSGNLATAIYTASWIAPKSDVHSQQRFFYQGHGGDVNVDQAHRGYSIATEEGGYASPNPLFMKYTPSAEGRFAGQSAYGYRSIADFVEAATSVRSGATAPADWLSKLATIQETLPVTTILEAGRRSLDNGGQRVRIVYAEDGSITGLE